MIAAVCIAGTAHAAGTWTPDRAVEIIAGSGAGGAQDRTARTMQKIWKERNIVPVPVNVVNKPGGGGAISMAYLNQQGGDGRYIAVSSPVVLLNHISGKSGLSHTDVTSLALLFSEYIVIAVRNESPIRTGADLIQKMKADPASVSAAVATARGGMQHIAVGRIAKSVGADVGRMRIAVFNSGSESITQVLGGHIDVVATAVANAAPHVANGQLRIIGIAAPQRLPGALANVPTWKEQGVDVVVSNWRSVLGPKGMTAAQTAWWDGALQKLVQTPEWNEDIQKNYWVNNYLGSAESQKFFASQYEELRGVLNDLLTK
ncbi:MAG: tripartite tricarboxylate transporter substrate binding protein [Burkholderiales bacterium]|nr:tripartite tricarboxylate transporter substrate binding protein [Burkholderiales bacterium]